MSNKPLNPNSSDKDSKTKQKSNPNDILKYSGMAFQMAAIMGIGLFIGKRLDTYFQTPKPYLMLLSIIIFGFAAFYLTLRGLFK